MQPYFFPYLGYFSLIKNTDMFILLDTVQYIYHGWIERNRILSSNSNWIYIKVPLVKKSRSTIIKDMEINNSLPWKDKILAQLQYYKKRAPFYSKTMDILQEVFKYDYLDIVELNKVCLSVVCEYLGIEYNIQVFSKMNMEIEEPEGPDEWALNICKGLKGVEEYWNPVGGKLFFNTDKYLGNNINIKFQKIILNEYDQRKNIFEEGLSIIDVLMFNSPEKINEMLDNYEFV